MSVNSKPVVLYKVVFPILERKEGNETGSGDLKNNRKPVRVMAKFLNRVVQRVAVCSDPQTGGWFDGGGENDQGN